MNDLFTITHEIIDGKPHLVICTSDKMAIQWPAVKMEITEEQWNTLKYGFATAVDDKAGLSKLIIIT